MQHEYLSPHQFSSFAPYVDTLLLSTHSPHPMDVASPYAASRLIANTLTKLLIERFGGRTAHLALGAAGLYSTWSEAWFRDLVILYEHPIHYSIVITDRILLHESSLIRPDSNLRVLVFDWWQWLRRRVPPARHADAILFMCQASEEYLRSDERIHSGLPVEILHAMAREGNQLFTELVNDVSKLLLTWWETPLRPK